MLPCLVLDRNFQNEIVFSLHSAVSFKEVNVFYRKCLHTSKVDYKNKALKSHQ